MLTNAHRGVAGISARARDKAEDERTLIGRLVRGRVVYHVDLLLREIEFAANGVGLCLGGLVGANFIRSSGLRAENGEAGKNDEIFHKLSSAWNSGEGDNKGIYAVCQIPRA